MYVFIKKYKKDFFYIRKIFTKMYTVIISDRGIFGLIFFGHDHRCAYFHFYFLQ